jgi:hypothetical protein
MEQVKQTAVEWMVNELNQKIDFIPMDKWDMIRDIVQQAKAMEKQEIINAYRDGRSDQQSEKPSRFYNRWAELYYYETYGGNK